MFKPLFASAALLAAVTFAPNTLAQHANDGAAQTFHNLTEEYFDAWFKFNPSAGTAAGFHQYDQQLEDYSARAVAEQVAFLHSSEKQLSAIDPKALDQSDAADLQVLENNISRNCFRSKPSATGRRIRTTTPPVSRVRRSSSWREITLRRIPACAPSLRASGRCRRYCLKRART